MERRIDVWRKPAFVTLTKLLMWGQLTLTTLIQCARNDSAMFAHGSSDDGSFIFSHSFCFYSLESDRLAVSITPLWPLHNNEDAWNMWSHVTISIRINRIESIINFPLWQPEIGWWMAIEWRPIEIMLKIISFYVIPSSIELCNFFDLLTNRS